MLTSILTLLALMLIVRLVAFAIHWLWAWLGRGKDLAHAVDRKRLSEEAVATHLNGERLARSQIQEVWRAVVAEREYYLDSLYFGWYQVVYLFLIGSVSGLVLEEAWMYVTAGLTQSRVGLVWGPFSPLYGVGTVLLTLVAFHLRRRHANLATIFLVCMVVGGVLEQVTGWGMDHFFHAQSWTYLAEPDHITQWVAWRFLFFWGALGLIWTKLIMPEMLFRIGEPTTVRQVVFVSLLALYLALDIFMTLMAFQQRAARYEGREPRNQLEEWVSDHYTDSWMASRFQNMVMSGD